jgi:hypothetical protein
LGHIEEPAAVGVFIPSRSIVTGCDMKKALGKYGASGFSLAEVIAALTIGAMILVAVLGVYSRAEHASAATMRKLDSSRLACEVLQRIAEDLDGIVSAGEDTKMLPLQNKFDHGFPTAQLVIRKTIKDARDNEKVFEEITWQSSYDYESVTDGLVLYRGYSGIALEDKVLDKNKGDYERELLVPICSGVTFFRISAVNGEETITNWGGSLPPGIEVTISFAEPYKRVDGTLDVPDEEKIIRTIAIDRTRKIKFEIEVSEEETEEQAEADISNEQTKPQKPR